MSQTTTHKDRSPDSPRAAEVLTLAEAAAYLRVTEAEVIELASSQQLPGRKIGQQWRFLLSGRADWLLQPASVHRLLRHAGVAKDDPNQKEFLKQVYTDRGRSMTEDGE
jgi:excisionase family DNA binding protein